MNIAETALPKTENRFRPDYRLLQYFTETNKNRRATGQAILQNESTINLAGKGLCAVDILSSETGNTQWVNGQAIFLGGADTSLVKKSMISQGGFVDVNFTDNPGFGVVFNFNTEHMPQNLAGIWPNLQPNELVLKQSAREDHVYEVISSSQKILTVAAAVFNNVRSLTDKERRHLRKFYSRAYKPR